MWVNREWCLHAPIEVRVYEYYIYHAHIEHNCKHHGLRINECHTMYVCGVVWVYTAKYIYSTIVLLRGSLLICIDMYIL